MHIHFARQLGLAATTSAALLLTACGGGSDDDNDSTTAPVTTRGTLAVSFVPNAPSCGLDAINVTVSKLRLRQDVNADPAAAGWTEVTLSPAKRLNLLHPASVLSGVAADLGEIGLPTGSYAQMALVLEPSGNTVRVAGAASDVPLEISPAVASGVRLPVNLTIEDGKKQTLNFEFNACDSIQPRGAGYAFIPRLRPVSTAAGAIGGYIDPAALASNVVITAQKGGTIVATAVPTPGTGQFLLPRLPRDNYDVVVQATGRATGVVGVVPVADTGVTALGTAAAPIRLATSAVSSISGQVTYTAPAVAPADGTWIWATQTISADPLVGNASTIVTNRLQAVDLVTGNYVLNNLARASIQYALYKPNTPIVLANATTSGGNGRYRIEAAATGFLNKTGTSANINTSSGNQTGVNISMP